MTLIELCVVIACLALGIVGSRVGGEQAGIAGCLAGFLVGVASFPVVLKLFGAVDAWFFRGPLEDPPCPCGKDSGSFAEEQRGPRSVRRCPCGSAFTRERGRFLEVVDGDRDREIFRWHWWRGWLPSSRPRAFRPYR
ncbi:MAG: hypothetical protein U0414_09835 [Polyangiaceae bacterium]